MDSITIIDALLDAELFGDRNECVTVTFELDLADSAYRE